MEEKLAGFQPAVKEQDQEQGGQTAMLNQWCTAVELRARWVTFVGQRTKASVTVTDACWALN